MCSKGGRVVQIITDSHTTDEIKKILSGQPDRPKYIRIFISGYGWGGPNLGLALDELKANDDAVNSEGVDFIMEKDLSDMVGPVSVQFVGNGFYVSRAQGEDIDCSSCSSCGDWL